MDNGRTRQITRGVSSRTIEPKIKSSAESTGGKIAGLTFSVCLCLVLIMLTVKLGVVLFT